MTTDVTTQWSGKLYSGGWVAGSGPGIEVRSPATGDRLDAVASATAADLDAAVAQARTAQRAWAALPYDQRAAVFLKAARLLRENPERLARWLIAEAGSGQGKAAFEVGLVTS